MHARGAIIDGKGQHSSLGWNPLGGICKLGHQAARGNGPRSIDACVPISKDKIVQSWILLLYFSIRLETIVLKDRHRVK